MFGDKFPSVLEALLGNAQGSVSGPDLFRPVRNQPKIFESCQFESTSFADDSNGKKIFAIEFQYNVCKNNSLDEYMMFFKINPEKTEIIMFHIKSHQEQVIIRGSLTGDQCIMYSEAAKNVGVWLDNKLNMDAHISIVNSHCYKMLKDLGRIRNVLFRKHTGMLVHTVISRLDYCNSLFCNLSRESIYKLQ